MGKKKDKGKEKKSKKEKKPKKEKKDKKSKGNEAEEPIPGGVPDDKIEEKKDEKKDKKKEKKEKKKKGKKGKSSLETEPVAELPCPETGGNEMEQLMAIAEQRRRDEKAKRAKTQNIIGHSQLERMRTSLAGFKGDSKSKTKVPRELLIANWERKMEPRLLSRLVYSLFGKNKREMPFKSYVELYWNLVEAKNQVRALTVIMISNCLSADDHPQETCMANLIEYITDIIGSYMHLLLFFNLPEMNQWLQLGYTNYTGDNRQVAKCLLSTCEVHNNIVTAGYVESWLYRCKLFNIINRQLFQGIYNLYKIAPGKTLLPTPCKSMENTIYMALSYVVLLNSLTTSHTDKWTLLFNGQGGFDQMQHALKDMAPTFIFVQDEQGYIFGGHASKPWEATSNWYGDEDSFLFQLRPDVYLYFASEDNENIQLLTTYGLAMGGDADCYGLFIDHSLRLGRTARTCETFLNYWPLAEYSVFQIKKLEVWGVIDTTETPMFTEGTYKTSRAPVRLSSSFTNIQTTGYQTPAPGGPETDIIEQRPRAPSLE
ncbi:TLD domain-containing protein 1-like [Cimex lectularius]|uniref:TLDc domain-containing protein n=1 Tax=Cimex lectularius TaxID=79782 RepID=A0A8I6R893_CIMLE|nr:TLD domain-containing protein 1-like [Cimex lectularius]